MEEKTLTFEEWLQDKIETDNWVKEKGFHCSKVDNYEVEFCRDFTTKNIAIRMRGMLTWFIFKNTTLSDIGKMLVDRVPFINSVQFVERVGRPVIIA